MVRPHKLCQGRLMASSMLNVDVVTRRLRDRWRLPHLAGHRGWRPVRVSNGAVSQFQLDVYGELLDALSQFLIATTARLDRDPREMLESIGETVLRCWQKSDEGIWEVRSGRFHHTHSKVLAWVAIDRLLRLDEAGRIDIDADGFRAAREAGHSGRDRDARLERCRTSVRNGLP